MTRSERTAYLLLLAMAACFGGTWVAGKAAVDGVPPATIAAARFALATLMLFAWSSARGRGGRPRLADVPLVLALGLTAVTGYNLLFLYGLQLAPATDGAIIVPGLAPILTAALARPLLGERIGRRGALGFLLAVGGIALVIAPEGGVDGKRLLGALLFVLCAVCWGVYSILGKTATARFHPVAATLYATAAGTLLLLPFSFVDSGWSKLAGTSLDVWSSVLYLAVFGTVVAFVLFYEGLKRIGPARAGSFTLLVPLFGVLGAVLLLGEPFSALAIMGGVAVLAGLWLVQNGAAVSRRRRRPPPFPSRRRSLAEEHAPPRGRKLSNLGQGIERNGRCQMGWPVPPMAPLARDADAGVESRSSAVRRWLWGRTRGEKRLL